ncbi:MULTISPECIES: NB-ARC domain-containing protein [Actinosynnema]|uniref:NB-ARC domain-containing protein n=1 Tax=Actinosynnema TaxID=40566 RepID=UPI0020A59E87|nr:NB-ARC domain-containing protein [Actinosynnema pretiosum]MCP2096692.1 NB-ARC domain-containing protein [Actinosynnema pretiosum]
MPSQRDDPHVRNTVHGAVTTSVQAERIGAVHLHTGPRAPVADWASHALLEPEALVHAEAAVSRLVTAISGADAPSAVTVSGAGGLGKTAITHAAVTRIAAEGVFDRIVWASAKNSRFSSSEAEDAALHSVHWHDVVRIVSGQLGCPLPANQALWEQALSGFLGHELAGTRLLVVVDNLEHVHAAHRVIGRLRELGLRHPHKVVATTRWAVLGDDLDVSDVRVRPLSPEQSCDLVRVVAEGTDLGAADDADLAPLHAITEGNPFLIKLACRRYLVTGRSMDLVLAELGTAADRLGGRVRAWLFDRSLDELRDRSGEEDALGLLFAFCAASRGGSLSYRGLLEESGVAPEAFDPVLETACRLGLVRPSDRNRRYSIHSLLYQYTCPLAWRADRG